MTREQRATRARLHAAVCDVHGFGRSTYGRQALANHVECVAQVVDRARERYSTGVAVAIPAQGHTPEVNHA